MTMYNISQDYMLPVIEQAKGALCYTKEQLMQITKDFCYQASTKKPIILLCIALLCEITETFYYKKYGKAVLEKQAIYQAGWYKLTHDDVFVMISTSKSICILLAILMLWLGGDIYR